MGLLKKYFSQTVKPEGFFGKVMLFSMGFGHSPLSKWGMRYMDMTDAGKILDIGCGSGHNIREFLKKNPEAHVDGVDYSPLSVETSRKTNREALQLMRCEITQASVDDLPFDEESFDLVSAFETVYFWPDLKESFKEVYRVLKKSGRFVIVNESDGTDKVSLTFEKIIDGMKNYTAEELKSALKEAGFKKVSVHLHNEKPWLVVEAYKEEKTVSAELQRGHYANWVPKGMIGGFAAATAAFTLADAGLLLKRGKMNKSMNNALLSVSTLGAVGCGAYTAWCTYAYDKFSYEGERKLSKDIVEGIASYVHLESGQTGLDVGCGSGALTIACAKRNPEAKMVGIDAWGPEYYNYSKKLCEDNADLEGVRENTSFEKGNAIHLDFADETFDFVTSNYVYHNIAGKNKQQLLKETLRVLKKGGGFAIHDLMSYARYGNMSDFIDELKAEGYEEVRLIDTANGLFMEREEAKKLMLSGSMLLVGRK